MFYKTLHWYLFRELLRIFFLTASALTTLLAFGGMFRPLTRQGVDIRQLLIIMMDLMPAMLAYAIPIAALFAAVLVYWRMSTDNEVTACRAGGISFGALVVPAFVLGVLVSAVDWGFVNYVVPRFLQATERAIRRDVAALLVSAVGRQEKFQFNNFVLYADSARQEDTGQPGVSRVILDGMAATTLKNGKSQGFVIARQAIATIRDNPDTGTSELTCKLIDAGGFDPDSFQKVTGSVDTFPPGGKPVPLPSLLNDKPKFYNRSAMLALIHDPTPFPDVAKIISDIQDRYTFIQIGHRLYDQWEAAAVPNGKPLVLFAAVPGSDTQAEYRVFAPSASVTPDGVLQFAAKNGVEVRVDQVEKGVVQSQYTADAADLTASQDPFSQGLAVTLGIHGNVMTRNVIRKIGPNPSGAVAIAGIDLPAAVSDVSLPDAHTLLIEAGSSNSEKMRNLHDQATDTIQRLLNTIRSEFNSRGSFSLSCLTLVLLGAALGIQLRGRNPLAVFVVGFVPAIILVLLITAGQQLAEGSSKHITVGISLIWAGNVILVLMVGAVYSMLLRR